MGKSVQLAGLTAVVASMVLVPRIGVTGTAPRVVVSVDNQARVAAQPLRAASDIATQIYAAAGIELLWCQWGDTPPAGLMHLNVLLTSRVGAERIMRGKRTAPGVLGLSPRDSRRVYVFIHRITLLAASDVRRFETILGRALAHEIGHHLLPEGHAPSGIMRARLDFVSPNAPGFSADEARYMRALLVSGQPPADPPSVLTRLDDDLVPVVPE